MKELAILQTQLTQVLNGTLRPSCIIGTGYKSPKGVASAWLRKEIHNRQNHNRRVDDVYVQVNGKPFATEAKAMQSKAYQQLVKGEFKLITDGLIVGEYGVMTAPGNDPTPGYCVYIVTTRKRILHS